MIFKLPNYLLSLLSALMLSIAWFTPFTFFIFFALVPLFILEDTISNSTVLKNKKIKIIGLSYSTFFIWNVCVTWWIYYASVGGAAMAFICNSIFMCVFFVFWHNIKKRINKNWAIWLFIPVWLGLEYINTWSDFSWTWLTLGNVFSSTPMWIQWYEFTGVSGGSLWILVVNILFYVLIKNKTFQITQIIKPTIAILLPLLFSYFIYTNYSSEKVCKKKITYKTLIVQPNVDPYNEKFNTEPIIQLRNLLAQISTRLDSTIDFLVLPETFLTEIIFEGNEAQSQSIRFLKDSILNQFQNLTIITGASTIYTFKNGEKKSSTAQKYSDANVYYDSYNTAIQLNKDGIVFYHKSKLVPGVEKMPLPALLKPLESLAINLGGTFGSLGSQNERTVFLSNKKQLGIAPVICYESVYADYVTEYIRNGANLIFIITNDGWWDNTPGHKQHLAYATLRAIETRREIARCANTGISCFINPLGEIEQATNYWGKAMILKKMSPNFEQTFFVRYGDLISYTATFILIILIGWYLVLHFKTKKRA